MTELRIQRELHIPDNAWVPAGIETVPEGWVNVYVRVDDLGRTLYRTEPCLGVLLSEAHDLLIIEFLVDEHGHTHDEDGTPYSEVETVDRLHMSLPTTARSNLDQCLLPAEHRAGYLGSLRTDRVPELLRRHNLAHAVPDTAD